MDFKWVNTTNKTPQPSDFQTTKGLGAPLVIDGTVGNLYGFLQSNGQPYPITMTVNAYMFGLTATSTPTQARIAEQALNDWYFGNGTVIRSGYFCDFSYNGLIDGTLYLGPSAGATVDTGNYHFGGTLQIQQATANTFETIIWRQTMQNATFHGSIYLMGKEGRTALAASKTSGVGITYQGAGGCTITGVLSTVGFWYAGELFVSDFSGLGNNDTFSVGKRIAYNCGSGYSLAGWSVTANWTFNTRTGTTRQTTQTDTLNVNTFPNAAIENYLAVGSQSVGVVISGIYYTLKSWNRAAGTITVYSWLDNTTYASGTGSGTLRYVYGGADVTLGSDSNIMDFGSVYILACGVGINGGALYGSKMRSGQIANCGVGALIGAGNNVHMGADYSWYAEGNDFDLVVTSATSNTWNYFNAMFAQTFSKMAVVSPYDTSAGMRIWGLGFRGQSGGGNTDFVHLVQRGMHYVMLDQPIGQGSETSSVYSFTDHSLPPRGSYVQSRTSQTIDLQIVDASFNNLLGYRGGRWRYVVPANLNGAPVGPFVFVPPTGGTVNGGAVNASYTFSGPFAGPVEFEIRFEVSNNQLTWYVYVVDGLLTTATGYIGYSSGGGGAVTQLTGKSTAVTLNKLCGQVTTSNAALAAGANITFTVNDSNVAATDVIIFNLQSGNATDGTYDYRIGAVAAGSFKVTLENRSAGSLSEILVFNYAIFKAANS